MMTREETIGMVKNLVILTLNATHANDKETHGAALNEYTALLAGTLPIETFDALIAMAAESLRRLQPRTA